MEKKLAIHGAATAFGHRYPNLCEQRSNHLLWRSATMAERRRRVEDMTTAVELPIKYQKTFNKKYTQEEAGDLVQQALL